MVLDGFGLQVPVYHVEPQPISVFYSTHGEHSSDQHSIRDIDQVHMLI